MSDSLGFLLSDVTRLLRRSFDARARAIGVTRPQWRVLTALARHEGCQQAQLADVLDVEPITLSRMIDRLQTAELVERRADQADRRAWRLHLTPRAMTLVDELRTLAEALFDDALAGIDATRRDALIATLDDVRANLSALRDTDATARRANTKNRRTKEIDHG